MPSMPFIYLGGWPYHPESLSCHTFKNWHWNHPLKTEAIDWEMCVCGMMWDDVPIISCWTLPFWGRRGSFSDGFCITLGIHRVSAGLWRYCCLERSLGRVPQKNFLGPAGWFPWHWLRGMLWAPSPSLPWTLQEPQKKAPKCPSSPCLMVISLVATWWIYAILCWLTWDILGLPWSNMRTPINQ